MREQWSRYRIDSEIRRFIARAGLSRMPTARELRVAGEKLLATEIPRHGESYDSTADRLGIARADHSSRRGWEAEEWFAGLARDRGLAVVARDRVKAPYDLTVSGVRVDVKYARGAQIANGPQWTWRIAKDAHVASVYAFVADLSDREPSLLLVPAHVVPLTCATCRLGGKYWAWKDDWSVFQCV